ncbi:hypothetical protein O1611_g9499 [Lasiodiplodia mahajangana]|uniref:Uncharacterized protein n=1 Tax=Lasiodiplodia mahajangana TaxID=1108764 RepID=A0ACC2J928_9PEZI|nr:hypothetical protein O1611_g9499 [Lasiodiplodia mahajangana]
MPSSASTSDFVLGSSGADTAPPYAWDLDISSTSTTSGSGTSTSTNNTTSRPLMSYSAPFSSKDLGGRAASQHQQRRNWSTQGNDGRSNP